MQSETSKESRLVLSFYGDDFTGSTDAMESLTINGLPTVLFLEVPDQSVLRRFPHIKCVGVAGNSRVMSPEEMKQELPSIFKGLKSLGSEYVHYKVCSTFDSSKTIGNIATVLEIGQEVFDSQVTVPVFVASPDLRRYTVFGNHFAAMGENVYRLDQHPVMSRHPITPMSEADLRVLLQDQGLAGRIELINVVDLEQPMEALKLTFKGKVSEESKAVVFDSSRKEHVDKVGELLALSRYSDEPLFLIGSSGVGHAISAVQQASIVEVSKRPAFKEVDQLLVVSGSCSPVTEQQLQWALTNGFEGIHLSLQEVMDDKNGQAAMQNIVDKASEIVKHGKSVIIYTALGPDDPSIKENQRVFRERGASISESSKILGSYLGEVAKLVIQETGLERLVVAGGDTSSYATRQLGIYALEMVTSISPGAPLSRCHSDDPRLDGLELALKGGQFGSVDYFGKVLTCAPNSVQA
ncbi:four-carbon acid sugar kinase family protein [Pullulanibacillus sp. KACC 23026]|uniref:four-carbon acid sugar kinase family protein n=1 Tax=Pullulanibacillus sp. KACC 23026 TaxID=3028315 RepID=UPI0023B12732|nr:four-carbon acid sugar kinase family protein [Pullulanibacillus sp. KACC 23026]WEG13540.1 four-carbon acid sugar kinase family protein [Pullulanibacillus sp. KACC 23026]